MKKIAEMAAGWMLCAAAGAAWAQPARVILESGEVIESPNVTFEKGKFTVVTESQTLSFAASAVRSVHFRADGEEVPLDEKTVGCLKGWIGDLGDDSFQKREDAFQSILEQGKKTPKQVGALLPKDSADPEVADRVTALRQEMNRSGQPMNALLNPANMNDAGALFMQIIAAQARAQQVKPDPALDAVDAAAGDVEDGVEKKKAEKEEKKK